VSWTKLSGDNYLVTLDLSTLKTSIVLQPGTYLFDFSGAFENMNFAFPTYSNGTGGLFQNQSAVVTPLTGSAGFLLIGSVNPVPEPATWSMLIAGFGMIGLGLRRRRRAASAHA
jgi:hypothetical protein